MNHQPQPNDGQIISIQPYTWLPFPSEPNEMVTFSAATYDQVRQDQSFCLQEVRYVSDGLEVMAYLYRPVKLEGQHLPAIIYNRGGYLAEDQGWLFAPFFHRLACAGFVIIAPQLRESVGSAGRDEIGGADVNDIFNLLPLIPSLNYVDMTNLFMYGESRGGMMTYQAIRDGFPLRAAAVFGAFTSLEALMAERPEMYQPLIQRVWPNYEEQKAEIVRRRSAVQWAAQIDVPILIMHGGADWSVNPRQSLLLAQKLQEAGKIYSLIIYAEDGHILANNEIDRDQRAIAWFRRYWQRDELA
jgi:dipeptidyl aminopeptidase/acylaminoacyl peptidase